MVTSIHGDEVMLEEVSGWLAANPFIRIERS